jgi:4-hydroxybenzoate polyprenyltransferase
MSKIEKKFAACLLAFGAFWAVVGYINGLGPEGYLMLLSAVLYVVYMHFTSEGEDDENP